MGIQKLEWHDFYFGKSSALLSAQGQILVDTQKFLCSLVYFAFFDKKLFCWSEFTK